MDIKKQIEELQNQCKHPSIAGEGSYGYNSVTWKCSECGKWISNDTVLQEGTILNFWSSAKLTRTMKFGDIRPEDKILL